ncbi:MAG: hypothetical protein JOZ19_11785 [Rubrobacter sp.]|nr:hypothetical protein [Rubrobacter sp.]
MKFFIRHAHALVPLKVLDPGADGLPFGLCDLQEVTTRLLMLPASGAGLVQ